MAATSDGQRTPDGHAASELAGVRVLVVEDEALVAMLIEDLLLENGAAMVGPAERVSEALKLIESESFDVALLDVNLAGETSYPIAERLAELGLPFVFSTGYGADGVDAKYRAYEAIQKPFQERDLASALARAAGKAKPRG